MQHDSLESCELDSARQGERRAKAADLELQDVFQDPLEIAGLERVLAGQEAQTDVPVAPLAERLDRLDDGRELAILFPGTPQRCGSTRRRRWSGAYMLP